VGEGCKYHSHLKPTNVDLHVKPSPCQSITTHRREDSEENYPRVLNTGTNRDKRLVSRYDRSNPSETALRYPLTQETG
jgi:hypothetical protein